MGQMGAWSCVANHLAARIHRVHNISDQTAISLHVYGADLRQCGGSSIRRSYPEQLVRPPT